jgi:hypothetical protein
MAQRLCARRRCYQLHRSSSWGPIADFLGWLVLDEQTPLARVGPALATAGVALPTRADRLTILFRRDF